MNGLLSLIKFVPWHHIYFFPLLATINIYIGIYIRIVFMYVQMQTTSIERERSERDNKETKNAWNFDRIMKLNWNLEDYAEIKN